MNPTKVKLSMRRFSSITSLGALGDGIASVEMVNRTGAAGCGSLGFDNDAGLADRSKNRTDSSKWSCSGKRTVFVAAREGDDGADAVRMCLFCTIVRGDDGVGEEKRLFKDDFNGLPLRLKVGGAKVELIAEESELCATVESDSEGKWHGNGAVFISWMYGGVPP